MLELFDVYTSMYMMIIDPKLLEMQIPGKVKLRLAKMHRKSIIC